MVTAKYAISSGLPHLGIGSLSLGGYTWAADSPGSCAPPGQMQFAVMLCFPYSLAIPLVRPIRPYSEALDPASEPWNAARPLKLMTRPQLFSTIKGRIPWQMKKEPWSSVSIFCFQLLKVSSLKD